MNQRLLEELAHQHVADLQHRPRRESAGRVPAQATGSPATATAPDRQDGAGGQRRIRQSLRERAGWQLVGIGLRMAAAPRPAGARPAGS